MENLSRRQIFAVGAGAAAAAALPAEPLRRVIDNQTGRRLDFAGRRLDSWNAAARGFITPAEMRRLEGLMALPGTIT